MRRIFVSYARESAAAARGLISDLQALGHTAWFDQELTGGQAWWDQILLRIRDADVLILILDPASIESIACRRECDYAVALGKPIVPVLVAEAMSMNLLPINLAELQFVDYRKPDRDSVMRLARSLGALPASGPLPDPLPLPPNVPASYLSGLASRVDAESAMTFEEQSALVLQLRNGLREAANRQDSVVLLRRLRNRRDLFAAVAENIDELLRQPAGTERPKPPASLGVSDLAPSTPPPAGPATRKRAGRLATSVVGAVIGMAIADGGLAVLGEKAAIDYLRWALIVGAAGAVAGAIAGREAKAIVITLLATVVGFAIALTMWPSGQQPFSGAALVGAPAGAVVGSITLALIRRYKAAR